MGCHEIAFVVGGEVYGEDEEDDEGGDELHDEDVEAVQEEDFAVVGVLFGTEVLVFMLDEVLPTEAFQLFEAR